MLVEIEDTLRHALGEMHLPRDFRPALAAGLDQFPRDRAAILQYVEHAAKPLGEPGLQPGMAEHEAQHLAQAGIDQLEVLLEFQVVG